MGVPIAINYFLLSLGNSVGVIQTEIFNDCSKAIFIVSSHS